MITTSEWKFQVWVDDLRPAPKGWFWVKNSEDAINELIYAWQDGRTIDIMSLDHDLGDDDTTRPVVLWCCENNFWPNEVIVHSANPVGIEWLEGMIDRYHPRGKNYRER